MSKVYLKDVVARIKDKVDKDNTDLEYYIGGEHFDNGEIQITKKGVIAGSTIGPAFHMKFVPGDVLLMSRNPHLRKAGVVDFEGICSDVSYVCRTKDENVLMQRFLPFIFQSDDFWRFAEENKKGSTNFFLNWSDFEKYEFNLPPIETQRKLVEILWSFEDTKTAYKKLLEKTDELVKSQFIEMFGDPYSNTKGLPVHKVGDLCDVTKLAGYEYTKYIHYQDSGDVLMIKGLNVKEKYLKLDDVSYIDAEVSDSLPRSQLHEGDVVMTYIGINLGDVAIVDNKHRYHLAPNVAKISVKDRNSLIPEFLVNQIYYSRDKFTRNAGNTAKAALNMDKIRKIEVFLPEVEAQKNFVAFAKQSDKSKFELKQAIADVDNLARALMQQELK